LENVKLGRIGLISNFQKLNRLLIFLFVDFWLNLVVSGNGGYLDIFLRKRL